MYEKIFKLLKEKGISQYQLSKAVKISAGNISDWKNNRSEPSVKALKKIADYFEVPVEYFFDGNENVDKNISIKITDSTLQNSEVTGIKTNIGNTFEEDKYIKKVSALMNEMTTEGKERMIDQAEFLSLKYKK